MPVTDNYGRSIISLRVSVTDRCNFSCSYCMPENNVEWFPHEEILTYEELIRLVKIFAGLGIRKVKVTGGEPTMRRDLHLFIGQLYTIAGIQDISLTTNGYFLDTQARLLEDAGLSRITVSLDSLKEDRFNYIVRRSIFKKIYNNILSLRQTSLKPVKINAVVIRGFNDDEVLDFIRFAQETGFIIRFIEFMPLDGDGQWSKDQVVPLEEMLATVRSRYELVKIGDTGPDSPSERYRLTDGTAEIGFIPTVSNPFCMHCGRIRITADGHLRTCLFSHHETDCKSLIRGSADDDEIREVVRNALVNKEEGHIISRKEFKQPSRRMYQIGG
ncbi:GTP 3',8-cyclase MoaA [candidate division KSB1 bacterium]